MPGGRDDSSLGSCKRGWGRERGSVSVLSSLCLSLQEFLTGTYAGGRQVMNEAEQSALA